MSRYRVKVEIDVYADNHTHAAQRAWDLLNHRGVKPVCDVTDADGNTEVVDLEEVE